MGWGLWEWESHICQVWRTGKETGKEGWGVAAVSLRCELPLCCWAPVEWALASLGCAWFLAHSCQHSSLP